jgi:ABC-type nitrate/sulfonate/bicarbonate transport system permease component
MIRGLSLRTASVILVVALCGAWWWGAASGTFNRAFVPDPRDVWTALADGFRYGELGAQTAGTLWRMAQGWFLAAVSGVAVGAVIGISPAARAYLQPTLEFLRPLPASAVIPVAIALFGLAPSMALFVIAFGSIWPVLLSTVHGFASTEPRLYEVGSCLQMSRAEVIWKIALPSAMADILAGIRLSLTTALILAIVTEMLAAQTGLGTAILLASRAFRAPEIFAGVAVLGMIGLSIEYLLTWIETGLLRWRRT